MRTTHNTKNNTPSKQQVRIIGGRYKRRTVNFVSAEGLRPTPDRVRETLFNWLMYDMFDAQVLDTCAGSGALGFEALSRGANHVTFIEAHARQVQCLQATQQQLGIAPNNIHIIHGYAEQVIHTLTNKNVAIESADSTHNTFDVVFLDPPYALSLWQPILTALITHTLISPQTKIYIEADKPLEEILDACALISDYELIKSKKIGNIFCAVVSLTITK